MNTGKDSQVLKKLYSYCAFQDRCRQEIEQKLRDLEVDEDEWESWLAHLEAERFWDEQRYVTSFVRGKFFHKHWGPLKIRMELRQRGIPDSMIRRSIDQHITSEALFAELEKLIERKWQEYRQTNRDKLIRFLLQKGYTWEQFGDLLPA